MFDLSSYLRITLRNLYREKLYAFINLAGLSLAVACCLILGLYLRSELTYDRHFANHENIYRIVEEFTNKGQVDPFARTGATLGQMMVADFPEFKDFVAFRSNPSIMMSYEDKRYSWDKVLTTTPNVFQVFKHTVVWGDPQTAFEKPGSMAVSRSFARQYFGDENPIGKTLTTDLGTNWTITLVFADLPENTHLKYDVLLAGIFPQNNPDISRQRLQLWQTPNYTYLLAAPGFDPADFDRMQQDFYDRNMKEFAEPQGMSMRYSLQPLADIHLHSNLQRDEPGGNLAYVYAFSAVALFILIVACINYTNLATARSMKRAKEVGMRKILGANRGKLMLQFLLEAVVFAFLAMVIGIIIVEVVLTLTPVNQLLGKTLQLSISKEPQVLGWLAGFTLAIGLLSGMYPAVYLSSWAPISGLVSSKSAGKSNVILRQGLVLVQFTISVGVIAATLLMGSQMHYLSTKSLGFDKENRVVIHLIGADLIQQIPAIKTELLQNPSVLGATMHDGRLGRLENMGAIPVETTEGTMENITVNVTGVDKDFFSTLGVKIKEGRDFSQHLLTDIGRNVIVNEALVRTMGWKDAIGKRIIDGRVIGVVNDFNFQSLRTTIDPLAMVQYDNSNFDNLPPAARTYMQGFLTVNIAREGLRDTLSWLQDRFAEYDPAHTFDFQFLDDSLQELYQSEESLMKLTGVFAVICILIACLGLFGLSSFTTEQRNKEIGIRKVLGAKTSQIILLLSRSILALVLVGGVAASLVSWLAVDEWLASFAYRVSINGLIFVFSILLALLVAYATVALQSYKTAQADPVDALRYE